MVGTGNIRSGVFIVFAFLHCISSYYHYHRPGCTASCRLKRAFLPLSFHFSFVLGMVPFAFVTFILPSVYITGNTRGDALHSIKGWRYEEPDGFQSDGVYLFLMLTGGLAFVFSDSPCAGILSHHPIFYLRCSHFFLAYFCCTF